MASVMRTGIAVLAAAMFGAGATQCALMPSLDGLAGSQGVPDAADELPRDAPPAVDAAAEGGDGGSRWCASRAPAPMFCDDFDDQGPLAGWTEQYVRAGGTVGRDGKDFRSAPNALLTVSPPAGSASSALLNLWTATTKSKVRVAYDMRIDARDAKTGYAELNYIEFSSPGGPFLIYFRASDLSASRIVAEVHLSDGGLPVHDLPLSGAPRFDVWTRVGVDVDVASTPHTLTVTLDGKVAATQALEANLYAPGPVSVRVGINYTGAPTTGDWRVRYDNVTIDWE